MFFSLADLREGVRFKADHSQNSRIQNDELDEYINDGIDQAQSIIFPLKEQYFTRRMYRDLVSGTREYRLPENSRTLEGVDVSTDSGSNYHSMRERDLDRRNIRNIYYFPGSFPYSFYFERDHLIFLSDVTTPSTNGLRFLYSWMHWDLSDSTIYDIDVTNVARADNIVTLAVADTNYLEDEQVVTLSGFTDTSLNTQYRVNSISGTTVTLYDEGTKPDIASTALTADEIMKVRYALDLPGGRLAKRYVEEWARFCILDRDDRDTSKAEAKLQYLAGRLKKNLDQRHRGRIRKVRKRNTYSGAAITPYTKGMGTI